MKRILITGGSGLLALNWACAVRDHWDVVLGTHQLSARLPGTTSHRLDLEDPQRFGEHLDQLLPDLVVHTAGLTSVDECEKDPERAHQVNAVIARNVAMATARRNIRLIHISTDHLFAGDHGFYREDEAPQPLNEYGRTKALAESWVQAAHADALTVRTNFFGWGHRQRQSFSDWLIVNLREGKTLSLFDDVYFTPILADALALAAHELIDKDVSGVVNLTGDERLSKYEFALQLAKEFSLPAELIRPNQLAHAHLLAKRPLDMSLDNSRAREILGRGLGTVPQFLSGLHVQEAAGRRTQLLESIC
ncbi:MAG: SDR family oxidoreductase [Burkholderiaceae bacterium]|nr:MAG: SDR family oxidoreductase [Burkholderiaceae bacterium]